MGYKTILVYLDASVCCEARLKLALGLAVAHEAHLVGMYATLRADSIPVCRAPAAAACVAAQASARREHAHVLRLAFDEATRRHRLSAEWRCVDDDPCGALVLHARHADLVIVGQHDDSDPGAFAGRALAEEIVFAGGRPVLIVPREGTFESAGMHPLVAWDGGRAAARAMYDALPMLQRAARTTVLSLNALADEDDDETVRWIAGADVATVLARQGVAAYAVSVESVPHIALGITLIDRASKLGADLIVAGASGDWRETQRVPRRVTRSLLRDATLPVLLSN